MNVDCYQEVVDDIASEEEAIDCPPVSVPEGLGSDCRLCTEGAGEGGVDRPDPHSEPNLVSKLHFQSPNDGILKNNCCNIPF